MRLKSIPACRLASCVVMLWVCASALKQPVAISETAPPAAPSSLSTRALFSYHRDDTTPGMMTRVHLDAARLGRTPIQQGVFGNFIEHLADLVYQVLWADALQNPNLERLAADNIMPPYWDTAGATAWPDTGGYLSPRFVRLSAPDGTLSQRIFLPTHRTRKYTLTFYARAVDGLGRITVSLRAGDGKAGTGALVLQKTQVISQTAWHKFTVHWTVPEGRLAKGQAARFFVTHVGGPSVDVDQCELFPDDAVDGMDPDVIKLAREWKIPVLRLAGNFSSGYHWRDGVGPRLARPTYRNVAWRGIETNHFGTDEFLDFSHRIGATPQIAANAGNGTPEEAADWVRYCNGKSERVPIWEIGNELYGGWQIGHTDAAGNAERFVRFRDAMRKADPRIKIIATGQGDEYLPAGLAHDKAWNDALLRAAIVNGGPAPDWLSIHPLVGLPGNLGNIDYNEKWESAMAHPAFMDQTLLPALIEQIQSIEGAGARTRIAPTEWGIIVGGDGWQGGPNHNVTAGAIYNALALNTFLRHGDWVTLANMTALLHGGCIKKVNGVTYVDPQYYTQKLYADAAPRFPVQTGWSGPGKDVPQRGFLPAVQNVPDVDVFSALTADRKRLTSFLVNRNLTDARTAQITLDGFDARRMSATVLTSADPQAGNNWEHPDNVGPKPFPLPAQKGKLPLTVTLPPHSLVVLTFSGETRPSGR